MYILDALHQYCQWHKFKRHADATISSYRSTISIFAAWLDAHQLPTDIEVITVQDARGFITTLQERTVAYPNHPHREPQFRPLSDAYILGNVRRIKGFFNWLHHEGYLTDNSMARLELPKIDQQLKQIITLEEMEQLLTACKTHFFTGSRMYALLSILFDTGMRIGEFLQLDVADVNLKRQHFHIRKSKSGHERFVRITDAAALAITQYLEHRQRLARLSEQAFIVSSHGKRWTRGAASQAITRHADRVNIPRLHAHLLRHSFSVHFLLAGGDQFSLKRILGHKELSTTDGYVDYAQQQLDTRLDQFSPLARVPASMKRPLLIKPHRLDQCLLTDVRSLEEIFASNEPVDTFPLSRIGEFYNS